MLIFYQKDINKVLTFFLHVSDGAPDLSGNDTVCGATASARG